MKYTGGDFELAIVCTNRGGHPSRDLGRVVFRRGAHSDYRDSWPADGGTIGFTLFRRANSVKDGRYLRPMPSAIQVREVGTGAETRGGLQVTCPTCRRNLPLNRDSVTRLVLGYRDAGQDRFDISMKAT